MGDLFYFDCCSSGAKIETLMYMSILIQLKKVILGRRQNSTQRNSRHRYAKFQTSSRCYMQNWYGKRWLLWKKYKQRGNIKFNDRMEIMSLVLDGSFTWSRSDVLENAPSIDEICLGVLHTNNGGIKNLIKNLCHHFLTI